MKKKEEKKELNVKKLVINIVLWTLGGVSVLLILLWDYMFKNKPIYGGENGFVAFGKWMRNNFDVVLYTIVVVGIVLLVIALLNLIVNLVRLTNKKALTVVSLVRSLIKWSVIIVAIFLILKKWGVDTNKILASIGIIALIIGLGCQTLISDVVAGIFLVADSAFEVGDIVVVDNFRGTVVEIGLKSTKLEDAGGNIKVISNSSINTLVNLTNTLSLSVVEISIPYEENLARTETLLIERLNSVDTCFMNKKQLIEYIFTIFSELLKKNLENYLNKDKLQRKSKNQ